MRVTIVNTSVPQLNDGNDNFLCSTLLYLVMYLSNQKPLRYYSFAINQFYHWYTIYLMIGFTVTFPPINNKQDHKQLSLTLNIWNELTHANTL